MDNIQEPYICKAEGFNTKGFPEYNDGMVRVNHGDIVSSVQKVIYGKMEFACVIKKAL